jgi:hypothetical protein
LPVRLNRGVTRPGNGGIAEFRLAGTNASISCCQWECNQRQEGNMHSVFYIIGVIVVVAFILSFLGVL